ncbi:MAG TPA: phosphatidate cytidylyltransferase [Polyangia bacterium]|nr:phosphatidate cytidylyltransferase [Polyangia bacterium]
MSNLALRALSAIVALPVLAVLVLWAPPIGFGLLVLLVAGLALHECAAIMLAGAPAGFRATVVALGVAFSAALYFAPGLAFPWTLAALTATAAAVLFDPGEIPAAGHRLGSAVFSVLYVGGLAAPLALLQRDAAHGRAWVLLAVAVTFGNDTGAYFAGRALGRHKLYPKVSPAKSVEGAVGGMAASVIIMFALRATLCPWLTVGDCLAVGVVAGVIGPIGDLVESLMKRAAGVKDSGRLIPGHGGMLDRIDALLFVAAWVYVYAVHIKG